MASVTDAAWERARLARDTRTAIGLASAMTLARLMTTMLFGIGPADPVTLTVVPFVVAVIAALASLVPAYRATRIDAIAALRGE